jgi:hypothetical protein
VAAVKSLIKRLSCCREFYLHGKILGKFLFPSLTIGSKKYTVFREGINAKYLCVERAIF